MEAIKISAAGEQLPADAAEFSAVLFPTIGLMFAVGALPEAMTHRQAIKAVKALSHAGFSDWILPTANELTSIIDRSRFDPACDPALFPDAKPSWYWGEETAWSSDYAWIVSFYDGNVFNDLRANTAFVRAVRRVAAASQ